MYQPLLNKVHRFLNYKWCFDLLYNRAINLPVMRFGFRVPFALIDKGVIEMIGPRGLYSVFFRLSLRNKNYQTGVVYQYAFYILSTLLLLLIVLVSLWS
jgi:NADH:ubiquinone oxidoreductase subunit 5 (subunit L)/multisubunit Na+/H+ antiporter MnhA subunit